MRPATLGPAGVPRTGVKAKFRRSDVGVEVQGVMTADIRFPAVYHRGAGAISQLGEICRAIGPKALMIGGHNALAAAQDSATASLTSAGIELVDTLWYGGECTWGNIEQVASQAQRHQVSLIVAVGGGKALDTGKAAAYQAGVACVTVPTIAATCAAFTPLSVVYQPDGRFLENTAKSSCPAAVVADSQILLEAPAKWLYAGMGDTLAKWYELRATTSKIPTTSWTVGGITNGKICYEVIGKFGPGAKKAAQVGTVTEDFEYVIDGIIFYAGSSSILGGEKCRGAAAHAIYFGFTNVAAAHGLGHGLLVGFGNLCLLALEERSDAELLAEIQLARECGVPTTLAEIADLSSADLQLVSDISAATGDMHNMPMEVSPQMVLEAVHRVDGLSRQHS